MKITLNGSKFSIDFKKCSSGSKIPGSPFFAGVRRNNAKVRKLDLCKQILVSCKFVVQLSFETLCELYKIGT